MKKLISLLLTVLILTLPMLVLAEAAPAPVVDITPLVIGLSLLLMCVLGFFTPKINRFLEQHNLAVAAEIAVKAAEALWGRYHGKEKLKAALAALQAKGYKVDDVRVLDAVRAAWQTMNLAQIGAGVKPSDEPQKPFAGDE